MKPKLTESPKKIEDLDYMIAAELSDKIIQCENCCKEGAKDYISIEELNNAYKKSKRVMQTKETKGEEMKYEKEFHPILFIEKFSFKSGIAMSGGIFGDGKETPEWFCPDCAQEHAIKLKYYKEIKKCMDLANDVLQVGTSVKRLDKKYPNIHYEGMDESGMEFYVKEGDITLYAVYSGGKESVYWMNEEELKKVSPQKRLEFEKQLEEYCKEIQKQNQKEHEKALQKHGWMDWEYDEGIATFRKDNLIITVPFGEDSISEAEVVEIMNRNEIFLKNLKLEIGLSNKGLLLESIWKTNESRKSNSLINLDKKGYGILAYRWRTFNPGTTNQYDSVNQENIQNAAMDIYRMIHWGGEANIKFSDREFKLYHTGDKFSYQFRYAHEPFGEVIELNGEAGGEFAFTRLADSFLQVLEWSKTVRKVRVIDTKITSVGVDSRHITLDKKEGLALFCGWDGFNVSIDYLPTEIPVRVNYYTDKIVIEKRKE